MYPTSFFIAMIVVGLTMLFAYHFLGYDMSRTGTRKQRRSTTIFVAALVLLFSTIGLMASIGSGFSWIRALGWITLMILIGFGVYGIVNSGATE